MARSNRGLLHYKTTEHAIDILLDGELAGHKLVKTRDLADRIGISQQHVFKIVGRLARAGLITCTRGPQGGVRLARPIAMVTVGDVVRALETKLLNGNDLNQGPTFQKAADAFMHVLDRYSVAEVAVQRQKKRPITVIRDTVGASDSEIRQRRNSISRTKARE